jgi:ATP-dependent DNA ligase
MFKSFAALCATLATCIEAESAVLDGEIVYLGSDGRSEFYNLMRRRTPQHFYTFDILWLDGKDLRKLPLMKRKQILRRVLPTDRRCSMRITSTRVVWTCSGSSARAIWRASWQSAKTDCTRPRRPLG